MIKKASSLALAALFFAAAAYAGISEDEVEIAKFSGEVEATGAPRGWKPFDLPRKHRQTEYSLQKDGDGYCLKAESTEAASALFKGVDNLDAGEYPIISWRWKVENTIKKGDERKKEGDDYAARVYVTFEYEPQKATFLDKLKHGVLKKIYGMKPPGKAINYIWANRLKKDSAVKNPFTDNVIMVAVESGPEMAGRWVEEERNVYEDYKRLFGQEPPRIAGVVIMTDTDNTGESATAYYGDIVFKRRPWAKAQARAGRLGD